MADLLFARDLEREYHLPESTWRFWHYEGKLPAAKVGRRLVWKRSDVIEFLASQGLDAS
ncbi:helix-turn-helix domain-containing protein [Mycobacterium sherrisii]|uniref:helix-turn-helix domain-containing protein n=1 Tax=Mycobacterium sherrisii TaxID=243061 RepID=UPI002DDD82B3|nr:helix-turn-helix domain-containing protein [Mycobacterium sherrisii]MEC4764767.1 helix-turn-helix domain-containing protein [Mycobacterium sherrisii]